MQLDINEIMKILPHRYPFLLVDDACQMTGSCEIFCWDWCLRHCYRDLTIPLISSRRKTGWTERRMPREMPQG